MTNSLLSLPILNDDQPSYLISGIKTMFLCHSMRYFLHFPTCFVEGKNNNVLFTYLLCFNQFKLYPTTSDQTFSK